MSKLILKLSQIGIKDVAKVGGKNASSGEMFNHLTKKGIRIPDGFCTTAQAFQYFLKYNKLDKNIDNILLKLDKNKGKKLELAGQKIRQMILSAKFPDDLKAEIGKNYQELCRKYPPKADQPPADKMTEVDVAVRSSATAEDLPGASFAGQQESYLNIRGEQKLLLALKRCFASLYTDRAISYRVDQGYNKIKISLSAGIQKMIRSDLACSGVMFTLDTESGFRDLIIINSSYGLGENVVKGRVTPDEFFVYKPTMAIIKKETGTKKLKLIYTKNPVNPTKNILTPLAQRQAFTLMDKEILQLAKWGMMIEKHYQRPMDMEWAKDGISNQLYIVQSRPETVESHVNPNLLQQFILLKKGKVLVKGESIGQKIASGKVKVIKSVKNINLFKPGEVLVTDMTDPDWEPVMKQAAAIVTNAGGRTCHAAIVSRELGVPAIVGTKDGTELLKNAQAVTISCAQGEEGYVYQGILPYKIKKTNLLKVKKPKVNIMINLGDPTQAFKYSFLPNQGIGLARLEFIITTYIKIHPLALINYKKMPLAIKHKIDELTSAYKNKVNFYVNQLAYGIAQIAAAFYPKDVIVRFSDFKTNEYANLIGGELYEPKEDNPMLGWRGASRYYDPKFKPAFDLECAAIKKVRDEMKLTNVKVMIPFCRTVSEGQKVIKILKEQGLVQGKNGLQVYVMVEIPSNVILAKEFARIFDGFSIGSNDLTQLTLGLDRDSELISGIADERNEAVKILIKQAIKVAKQQKIKIGICGQAPSDFPDFAKFLMKEGIDSISLNPDTVIKTSLDLG